MKPTQERLKEVLDYDPDTGIFRWKVRQSIRVMVGAVAGYKGPKGYIDIRVDGIINRAHRLAWLYHYGYMPELLVDHINGINDDNRIYNLRHVSNACNLQNSKLSSTNTSGFKGVSWSRDRKSYTAQICSNNKAINLGRFSHPLEAALARLDWQAKNPDKWGCDARGVEAHIISSTIKEIIKTTSAVMR